jgi:thiamine-phosphate pyrophosphorylase
VASLDLPALCLVTDRRRCAGRPLEEVVARAVDGGAGVVQLREKDLAGGDLLALAKRLRAITNGRALLFINDRIDVALAAGADGVQLPEQGLPLAAAIAAGGRLLKGRSVHSVDGAVEAESQGADLLVVGTVFPTASHAGAAPQGTGILEQLSERVQVPFFPIGGVTRHNIGLVIGSGAAGAAVTAAITESDNPEVASRQLVEIMAKAWARAPRARAVAAK